MGSGASSPEPEPTHYEASFLRLVDGWGVELMQSRVECADDGFSRSISIYGTAYVEIEPFHSFGLLALSSEMGL